MAGPSGGGINKAALQWAFLVALCVVAVAYFVMPARAAVPPAGTNGALERTADFS